MTAQTYGGQGWVDGGDGMFFFFFFISPQKGFPRIGKVILCGITATI